MIDVLVCGIGGKMGKTVCEVISADGEARVACGVDICAQDLNIPVYSSFNNVKESVDVIIDFSSPSALFNELEWAKTKHIPAILAATRYSEEDLHYIKMCSQEIAIFKTANFSLGINLLAKLVREAAAALGDKFDIEIIEKHHRVKADSPSGTALMLAESANTAFGGKKPFVCGRFGATGSRGTEIGLHSVRGGTIVGEHEVIFAGEDEIVTISHSARSKKVFAEGAIKAAKWIIGKPYGLYNSY